MASKRQEHGQLGEATLTPHSLQGRQKEPGPQGQQTGSPTPGFIQLHKHMKTVLESLSGIGTPSRASTRVPRTRGS